jgi:hypothetical protein
VRFFSDSELASSKYARIKKKGQEYYFHRTFFFLASVRKMGASKESKLQAD